MADGPTIWIPPSARCDSRIPEEYRYDGVRPQVPSHCYCCPELPKRLVRRRNETGTIYFCPRERYGYIQFNGTGVIIDGIFRGDHDGD